VVRLKNKTLPKNQERNKRVAKTESNTIVEIPLIVRIGIVGIEPTIAIIVTLDVEHVRVTVRVGPLCIVSSVPPHLKSLSTIQALYNIRDLKSTKTIHQVSSFFEVSTHTTLF
jgi:hypothetical protein